MNCGNRFFRRLLKGAPHDVVPIRTAFSPLRLPEIPDFARLELFLTFSLGRVIWEQKRPYELGGDSMLLLIIILILLFGGGGGYYGYSRWGAGGGLGILGTVLLVVLIMYLVGALPR
jgi:hypothetical protein